jgi:uncharacterized protein YegP (UPF0339 family)
VKRPALEITIRPDGTAFWHLIASNGKILCHSEDYSDVQAARKGISAARRAILLAVPSEYEIQTEL